VGWVVAVYPDGSFDADEQYWGGTEPEGTIPCETNRVHHEAGYATGGFVYDPEHPLADNDEDGSFSEDDCNDFDAQVHPGALENCGNQKDDDCDAATDLADIDCKSEGLLPEEGLEQTDSGEAGKEQSEQRDTGWSEWSMDGWEKETEGDGGLGSHDGLELYQGSCGCSTGWRTGIYEMWIWLLALFVTASKIRTYYHNQPRGS
jgi:hypothetical protein